MAIPSTGPLSGTNINDEFPDSEDGGLPMQLSEYRGLTVSKNGQVFTIPQSPSPISYSDFQGVIYAYEIEIWVVGGGGGGSSVVPGGGGGAGRLETGKFLLTPGTSHNIVVGNGGNPGFSGNQSRFGSLITALGGTAGTNDKGGRSNFLGSESSVDTEGGGGGGTGGPGIVPERPGTDGYGGVGTTISFPGFIKNIGGGGSGGKFVGGDPTGCVGRSPSGSDFGGGLGGWNRNSCSAGVDGTGGGGGGNGISGGSSSRGGGGVVIVRNITLNTFQEFLTNDTYIV